jgi:hypothetical protein
MRTTWSLGVALCAALSATLACTEDADEDPGAGFGGLGGAAGGSPASGGGQQGGAGGAGGVARGCDPEGPGVCANPTDCPLVTSGQLEEASYACADLCAAELDAGQCTALCTIMELNATAGCSACYAERTDCATRLCFGACLADPSTDECAACLETEGCTEDFRRCSGVLLD